MNELYHCSGYLLASRRLVWPTNPPLFLIRKVIAIELALICPPPSFHSSLPPSFVIKTCFVMQSITTTCPFARPPPPLPSSSPSRPTDRRRSRRNSRASVISGICASAFPRPAHWFRPFKSSVRPRARHCIETPNLNGRKNRHIQFYERSGAR